MKALQVKLTPVQGKKLIADALCAREDIQYAAKNHTVLVLMGTTNAYLAEALAESMGAKFDKRGFFRGVVAADGVKPSVSPQKCDFVIRKGKILTDKTVFDIAPELTEDDIIFKGANAVNLSLNQAGILIGHPNVGTMLPIIGAQVGRRVTLIHPVGVEKRVELPIDELAALLNTPGENGPRMLFSTGEVYTELDAFADMFGLDSDIIAAGGVGGAEGCCIFRVEGEDEDVDELKEYLADIQDIKAFEY